MLSISLTNLAISANTRAMNRLVHAGGPPLCDYPGDIAQEKVTACQNMPIIE
jgi:hypothetical protein